MADHIKIGDITPRTQETQAVSGNTDFTFSFPIFVAANLLVYVDGTLQTLTTDYTVTGAGESTGGTVTFGTAPDVGAVVTILRRLAISRTTDFQESGEFRANVLNNELDYQTAALQQVADDLERALVLDPTDPTATLTLPVKADRAGKFLAFGPDGDVMASAGGASVAVSAVMEPVIQAASLAAARTALGLGSAAVKDTGTDEGNVVEVQAGGALPALDGSALTGIATGATDAERANILLNAFRIQVVGGLSVLDMIDGVVDEFEDETGVNTGASSNQIYNSADDYYTNPGSTDLGLAGETATGTNTNVFALASRKYAGIKINSGTDTLVGGAKISINAVNSAGNIHAEVWTDGGVSPAAQVGSSSPAVAGATGVVEMTFSSPITVSAATNYWIVIVAEGGEFVLDTCGTAGGYPTGMATAAATSISDGAGMDASEDLMISAVFLSGAALDMTLISQTTTAEAQPDEAHLIVWEEDVDSITLNTDLLAYNSRDGGTTWTLGTLAEAGSLGTGRILTATIDISGQPAGTTMAWKLVTANSKELKIHGVGLEWR